MNTDNTSSPSLLIRPRPTVSEHLRGVNRFKSNFCVRVVGIKQSTKTDGVLQD